MSALGHVWTAPFWQGFSEVDAGRSGAVMCPACLRGTWPLALMRFADRVPIKSARFVRRDPSGVSRPSVPPIVHDLTFTLPN